MKLKDRVRGCILGGAIGDALGYQIEFVKNVKEKQVTRFNGTGIISDDTQMTLFTANALIWDATRGAAKGIAPLPHDAIRMAYKDWLATQSNQVRERNICWISNIPELNIPRAPGNTCLEALYGDNKGTIENRINNSKGCGAVMRVAPIGIFYGNSIKVGEVAAESAALTHGHDQAIMSSYVLATMIYKMLYDNKDMQDSLELAMRQMIDEYNIFDEDETKYFTGLLARAVMLSQKDMNDLDAIAELGEGWVAEEALAIAVYACLKYKNNFEDAIVCAVNHPGDSDSTGAIAGNIIGAYLGIKSIPDYYLDNIELKDVITEIADDLIHPIPDSFANPHDHEYWNSKYVLANRDLTKKGTDKEEKEGNIFTKLFKRGK